jgi:hypothetical protein
LLRSRESLGEKGKIAKPFLDYDYCKFNPKPFQPDLLVSPDETQDVLDLLNGFSTLYPNWLQM